MEELLPPEPQERIRVTNTATVAETSNNDSRIHDTVLYPSLTYLSTDISELSRDLSRVTLQSDEFEGSGFGDLELVVHSSLQKQRQESVAPTEAHKPLAANETIRYPNIFDNTVISSNKERKREKLNNTKRKKKRRRRRRRKKKKQRRKVQHHKRRHEGRHRRELIRNENSDTINNFSLEEISRVSFRKRYITKSC